MAKKTFFSIIIPVAENANPKFLKVCLKSISKQTYKYYEIIKIYEEDTSLGKSAARNFGAKKARGDYLLHIDVDYILPPKILEKAVQIIKLTGAKTIILHETIKLTKTVWQKARSLEREIALSDPPLSAPQLIEKKLFEKLGGFDERVDALDDWALYLKLKKAYIKTESILSPLTGVYEPTNIAEIISRRYKKGQYLSLFKKYYGDIPQTRLLPRLSSYWINLRKILLKPHIFIALLILKIFDLTAFYLGSLNPFVESENLYGSEKIAKSFDREQKGLYGQYKHKKEVQALLALLSKPRGRILELGAGTGRITRELVKRGYKVMPTDVSSVMLAEFEKKKGLPEPILIKSDKLPFSDNKFEATIAIRVIWHILGKKKREKFLKEAIRVSKKYVIMDFAMKGMGLNFPFKNSYYFTKEEVKRLARVNKTEIVASELLPLGRLLIKLSKK